MTACEHEGVGTEALYLAAHIRLQETTGKLWPRTDAIAPQALMRIRRGHCDDVERAGPSNKKAVNDGRDGLCVPTMKTFVRMRC